MAELLDFLGSYWWVLLIFTVFIYSAFEEWLQFKTEQRKIGASTKETEEKLDELRSEWDAERKRLNKRIQHLETIVTSDVWDAAYGASSDASDRSGTSAGDTTETSTSHSPLLDDLDAPDELSHEEKAERLARRLRNR
ncbi:MAG: hypothetical protein PPP56_10885 [Longimonas sp.]|uniref:hypothetical protein n=1 Tax=Longimonas sp. TaxID=2039626 RepID=UPI0033498E20